MSMTSEELKKEIEKAKGKLAEVKKGAPKQGDPKFRSARKVLKRAQRRLRQASGKKLATIRKKTSGDK